MRVEAISITIHEMAELLREGLRAKGVDPSVLVIQSYEKPRLTIHYDGKTDSKGRLLHRVELERSLVHWTYHGETP